MSLNGIKLFSDSQSITLRLKSQLLNMECISSSLPAMTSVRAPGSPTHTHTHRQSSRSTVSSTFPRCSRTLHYFVPLYLLFQLGRYLSTQPKCHPSPSINLSLTRPPPSYLVCALHLHSTMNRLQPQCLLSCFHNLSFYSSVFLIRHKHFKAKTMMP